MISIKKYVYALNWFYRVPIIEIDREFWGNVVPNDLEEDS